MALTPLGVLALRWRLPKADESMDGVDDADGLAGSGVDHRLWPRSARS